MKILFTFFVLFFISGTYAQTCGDFFQDSGGENSNYSDDELEEYVICPTIPNSIVKVNFLNFNLEEDYDFLTVYNGNSSSAPEIGSFTGTTILEEIVADNPTGCLTFVFESDGSITESGWNAIISCFQENENCLKPTNLSVSNLGSNDATISWTALNGEGEWVIEYGLEGFEIGTGTVLTSNVIPFQITGLQGNINYDVYVRAVCSVIDSSIYSLKLNFKTNYEPLTCGSIFLDPGSNENYENNENFTITACPENPNEIVQIIFSEFNLEEDYDFLTIYNGNTTDAEIVGTYTGIVSPNMIYAENITGCLTFNFTSDDIVTETGWNAQINCIPAITCFKPLNLEVNEITSSSAILSWNSQNQETTWILEYGENGFSPGNGTTIEVNSNPFLLENLNAATTYQFFVKAICEIGDTSFASNNFYFNTLLEPFICGNSFFDNGGLENYENGSMDTITICPNSANERVEIIFSEFELETNWDFLTVYNGNNINNDVIGIFTGNEIQDTIRAENNSGCLTFLFESDGVGNLIGWEGQINCIPQISCFNPSNIIVSNISDSSAQISWSAGSNEIEWIIEYQAIGSSIVNTVLVSENPFNLTNLSSATEYTISIRALCSDTDTSSNSAIQTFTTSIAPFICGNIFIDNGGLNDYLPNSNDTITICPSNPGEAVQLNFTEFNTEQGYDSLFVYNGSSTSNELIAAFTGISNIGILTANNESGCLTLRFKSDGSVQSSGWSAAITCVPNVFCEVPVNLIVTSITETSAILAWSAPTTQTNWLIEKTQMWSNEPISYLPSGATSIILNNLDSATYYNVRVQSICSSDSSDFSLNYVFKTKTQAEICGNKFYDESGPSGWLQSNTLDTTTICPIIPGQVAKVIFTEIDFSLGDTLKVLNGATPNAPSIQDITSTQNGTIQEYTGSSSSGCLTFLLKTNNIQTEANGWAAEILCIVRPLSVIELNNEVKLSLHPNPVSEILFLTNNSSEKIEFTILTSDGKIIIADSEIIPKEVKQIEVNNLSKGIYFIKFNDGNFQKFVKE